MADMCDEDDVQLYENNIRNVLEYFKKNGWIVDYKLTEHNSQLDKLKIDAVIWFRINGKCGVLPFQLKRRWCAILRHERVCPSIPVLVIQKMATFEEIKDAFIDFLAYYEAYNFDKEKVFAGRGFKYFLRVVKYSKYVKKEFIKTHFNTIERTLSKKKK